MDPDILSDAITTEDLNFLHRSINSAPSMDQAGHKRCVATAVGKWTMVYVVAKSSGSDRFRINVCKYVITTK